jgi:hypothetical protein
MIEISMADNCNCLGAEIFNGVFEGERIVKVLMGKLIFQGVLLRKVGRGKGFASLNFHEILEESLIEH